MPTHKHTNIQDTPPTSSAVTVRQIRGVSNLNTAKDNAWRIGGKPMFIHQPHYVFARTYRLIFTATVGVFTLFVLAGCGAKGTQLALPTLTVDFTSTPVIPSPTVNFKDAADTRVAENYNIVLTEVALTHAPTWTMGPPPDYPSETPELGLSTHCLGKNSRDPRIATCWTGIVNGEMVYVDAGREGLDGDPTWGIIMVGTSGHSDAQLIRTPWKVGAIRIAAINGTLFTVAPIDFATPRAVLTPWATTTPGVTFVFDIVSRQWVSPPPSPTITITPQLSPIPTTLPLPSPSP